MASVVMMSSPCRFGYDHTWLLDLIDAATPPGSETSSSCTAFDVVSTYDAALPPLYLTVDTVVADAGTTSTATRFH